MEDPNPGAEELGIVQRVVARVMVVGESHWPQLLQTAPDRARRSPVGLGAPTDGTVIPHVANRSPDGIIPPVVEDRDPFGNSS